MISFRQYLSETPLPDDWDKEKFTNKVSYKDQIKYAVERAQKIGKGSSRSAFLIDYKGRETILKVAHNGKGRAQNEVEAKILSDSQVPDIVIPIIDYDLVNHPPIWIHTEKAEKVSESKLCELMNTPSLKALVAIASNRIDRKFKSATEMFYREVRKYNNNNETKMDNFESYVNELSDLYSSYDIQLADFETSKNWGLYKGKPVIIDVGFSFDVSTKFYNKKL